MYLWVKPTVAQHQQKDECNGKVIEPVGVKKISLEIMNEIW